MTEILIMMSLAIFFGAILIFLDSFLLKGEEKKEEILKQLPGYNCGTCGYGSCDGMAEAILKDKDAYKKCKPMKKEAKCWFEDYLKKE